MIKILCFGIALLLHVFCAKWMEPVSRDPNGHLFIDIDLKNNTNENKITAVRPQAIEIELKTPLPGVTVNEALIEYIANLLEIPKEHLSVFADTGTHKILELINEDILVDDKELVDTANFAAAILGK